MNGLQQKWLLELLEKIDKDKYFYKYKVEISCLDGYGWHCVIYKEDEGSRGAMLDNPKGLAIILDYIKD